MTAEWNVDYPAWCSQFIRDRIFLPPFSLENKQGQVSRVFTVVRDGLQLQPARILSRRPRDVQAVHNSATKAPQTCFLSDPLGPLDLGSELLSLCSFSLVTISYLFCSEGHQEFLGGLSASLCKCLFPKRGSLRGQSWEFHSCFFLFLSLLPPPLPFFLLLHNNVAIYYYFIIIFILCLLKHSNDLVFQASVSFDSSSLLNGSYFIIPERL